MEAKSSKTKSYDISTLSRLMKKDFVFVIAVFLMLLIIFTDISVYESFGSVRSRKLEAQNIAVLCASEIERNCNHTFQLNGIISSLVMLGEANQENFDKVAAKVLPDFPAADCVQLAPGGIVSTVYPLKGNEAVLGHNLFEDEKRADEAFRTKAAGTITIGGPYPLLQGGEGFIGRLPVFMDDEHSEFWGFVNVVVRVSKIIETVNLSAIDGRNYTYSIYKISDVTGNRTHICGTDFEKLHNPITVKLDMPNAHWELVVAPKGLWVNIHLVIVLGTLSLLFICAFTMLTMLFFKLRQSNVRLAQLATLDQLTGLYTKQTAIFTLKKEIDYAARNGTQVAVCFIDMNNFKQINDIYGHTVGDTALAKVAKRLMESVRPEDIIARFGGDEFIIIFRGKNTGTDYHNTVERIKAVLNVPAKLSAHVLADISASVGLAVYPANGQSVEELISYADKAMYAEKARIKKEAKSRKDSNVETL